MSPGQSTVSSNIGMQKIWLEEARKNKEYFAFVRHAFEEKNIEFVLEPIDPSKALEHAKNINEGNWIGLDFNDPQFTRNIFKALRLEKINGNQAATAILLKDGRNQLCGDEKEAKVGIRQFKFGEGPYKPENISYACPKDIMEFDRRLRQLPQSEQHYFTLDLSRKSEVEFITGVVTGRANESSMSINSVRDPKLKNLIEMYIDRNFKKNDPQKYDELIRAVNDTACSSVVLLEMIFKKNKADAKSHEVELDRASMRLIGDTFSQFSQHPDWEISPNFDKNNPESPLVSLVLPSMAAFDELQIAVHGEEDATKAHFVFGEASIRYMRQLDETPEKFGEKRQARVFELVHPDVPHAKQPHGLKVHPFSLAYHDLFHCWNNSLITFKPFIRYLRRLIHREIGFDMSKPIWFLTDMDFFTYRVDMKEFRDVKKSVANKEKDPAYEKVLNKINIMKIIKEVFCYRKKDNKPLNQATIFFDPAAHDNYLMLILDMIRSKEKWKDFLGQYPIDFFSKTTELEKQKLDDIGTFSAVYKEMEGMLSAKPGDQKEQFTKSTSWYILLFRLTREGFSRARAENICEQIHFLDKILKPELKILQWDRNHGIKINEKYLTKNNEQYIACFSSTNLVQLLLQVILEAKKNVALETSSIYQTNLVFFNTPESKENDLAPLATKLGINLNDPYFQKLDSAQKVQLFENIKVAIDAEITPSSKLIAEDQFRLLNNLNIAIRENLISIDRLKQRPPILKNEAVQLLMLHEVGLAALRAKKVSFSLAVDEPAVAKFSLSSYKNELAKQNTGTSLSVKVRR